MLAQPHSELLDKAPPINLHRIFVGNLTAQISDTSLHQLLSRFGTISNFARSKCNSFAHTSLDADEASLLKCTSSLNNAKWFGTSLRVEKAKQHYLNRLRKEWEQSPRDTQCITTESDIEESETNTRPPFHNVPKGKHVRFSFADDEPLQHTSQSFWSPGNANEPQQPVTRPVLIKSSLLASKQNSLQTTLSLFGLSPTIGAGGTTQMKRSAQETPTLKRESKRPRKVAFEKRQSESIESSPASSTKLAVTPTSNDIATPLDAKIKVYSDHDNDGVSETYAPYSIENAEAVGDDPSKIDLERERGAHLKVLRSMFPDYATPVRNAEPRPVIRKSSVEQDIFTRCRRAALYSKLQTPVVGVTPLQVIKRPSPKSKSETTKHSRPDLGLNAHQATASNTNYRHAALYKKLQFMQHLDAS